jgi:hypothetical protein
MPLREGGAHSMAVASDTSGGIAIVEGKPTTEYLTAVLAERVMGWAVGPDRFLIGNRCWMPRWRFAPTKNLDDAFLLLKHAGPEEYSIRGDRTGSVQVTVRIGDRSGEACDISIAGAITCAIARALDLPEAGPGQ